MKVRDIMTSEELATATLDTTLEEIASMMKTENVGAIPILDEEDNLAGIITDRDIVVRAIAEGQDPSSCTAEEILSEELHTIEPDAELEEAADVMARHKIRRLPVVEDRMIVGMISLGDISVKFEDEKAGEALGDISEGVKESKAQRASGDGGRRQVQGGARGQEQRQSRGAVQRAGSVDSQFNVAGRSSGEAVAEEETEYQRESTHGRNTQPGAAGGTRAESALAGRIRNQSKSQQSVANDLVNTEGEEEPEFQNAGGGQARRRANQQQPAVRGRQPEVRGRQQETQSGRQGISNRDADQERKGQQKVTSVRAEARNASRNRGKKRAS
jgi:CBS domain-containing protein